MKHFDLPTDLNGYRVDLVATHQGRDIARSYIILASKDLFGWTVIERRWGKIGAKARSRTNAFQEETTATQFVRSILTRRASALQRFGVAYTQQR